MDKKRVKDELEQAESDLVSLVKIAEGTVDELKRVPECDEEPLADLSQEYLVKLKGVQETLKSHAEILDKARADREESTFKDLYLQEKEEELARSEKTLQNK